MALKLVGLMALWLGLTRSLEPMSVGVGVVVAVTVVWVTRRLFPDREPAAARTIGRRVMVGARFAATLAVRFVASTLTTSFLILCGRDQGRVVAVPIRLSDPGKQFLLLNAITLTPSTISLLLESDLLYVHWLVPDGERADVRRVKDALERALVPDREVTDDRGR